MFKWQQSIHSILDIFSSSRCGLCDRPTPIPICSDCQEQLHTCQLPNPEKFWHPPLPVFAWGRYTGELRRGIAALKYENQPQMARLLGQWLGMAWLQSPLANPRAKSRQALIVIPVPANGAKKKRRGYDQAELIAQAFCQYTKLPLDTHQVLRTEDTAPMHGLSFQDRQRNVAGKFQLHPRVGRRLQQGRNAKAVLLLDDIHTSGATLMAIAHLLRRHQVPVYGAVTVAKAGLEQKNKQQDTSPENRSPENR